MNVLFVNTALANSSFSVQWDGGESGRTAVLMAGQTASIDMKDVNVPAGASCWARAYVQAGRNHDSESNFTVGECNVTYVLSGTVDDTSFLCN